MGLAAILMQSWYCLKQQLKYDCYHSEKKNWVMHRIIWAFLLAILVLLIEIVQYVLVRIVILAIIPIPLLCILIYERLHPALLDEPADFEFDESATFLMEESDDNEEVSSTSS